MKIQLIILVLILVTSSCSHHSKEINQFVSTQDTLLIQCKKQRGEGLFDFLGVLPSDLRDTTADFGYTVMYPGQMTDIKRDKFVVDLSAENPYYIDLLGGNLGEHRAFVVDENNNKDFRDDSIRILKPIDWNNDDELIKVTFSRSKGQITTLDSSWLRIGEFDKMGLWYGKCEHLTAEFNIGNSRFKVGAVDLRTPWFEYKESTEIALISENEIEKDTLFEKDLLKLDEFIKLNGTYYRFAGVDVDGDNLTLVKAQNFSKEIGTQVGMIAPDFMCRTVSGDTIKSSDLHDRVVVIANSCECGGDEKSTKAFYDMTNLYAEKIVIIRLDSKIEKKSEGIQVDTEDTFNKDFIRNTGICTAPGLVM